MRSAATWLAGACVLLLAAGCSGVGPQRLGTDQIGYTTALGEGLKRQMLLNIVRLRYADVPTFLTVSQLISGYTLQSTGQIGLNAYPDANPGNYATLSGTLQYTTRPTFTFTPVTGEQFAQSYLRPLAPAELLSLAQSGAPIDLLFRLRVQSVNGLPNRVTTGGAPQQASHHFEVLMRAFRDAQAAGATNLRFERHQAGVRVHVMLEGNGPRAVAALRQIRQLLGLVPAAREFEVVYGRYAGQPGQVAVLTRPVLQILYELGMQIEVAQADIRRGEAPATEADTGGWHEPLITVHRGEREPPDVYASAPYRNHWFWIEADDYRSKTTFTYAYVLQVLAESSHGRPTAVVTIPAQ